uniref:C-type lectin domain-containing protein n=1 Tax=Plectus sambesii TaxID=2011161 RepID=A0A914X9P8_9BILA
MSLKSSHGPPSLTVSYGSLDIGIFPQEGQKIKYASLDRAGKVISQLPQAKRQILLAPIEQGLLDPQSVFYLIDDKSEGQIAICVEDFIQLASVFHADEETNDQKLEQMNDDVPQIDVNADKGYTSIEDDRSSGYSSHDDRCRSRGESTLSKGEVAYMPALPDSRPPAVSMSLSNSSFVLDGRSNSDSKNADSWGTVDLIAKSFSRKIRFFGSDSGKCKAVAKNDTFQLGQDNKLVDLHLPEKPPTFTIGSLQYLFIPNRTQWFLARRYCNAWCGRLVSIRTQADNQNILDLAKSQLPGRLINYWIGTKGWKGSWYLDDETSVTYFNFLDLGLANESIASEDIDGGCIQANASGIWSLVLCGAMNPFVCERNTAENIRRTPFYPHQEKPCTSRGGRCKMENDCKDGTSIRNLCPIQANDILCCVPHEPLPTPYVNSSMKTCADAGGICNHMVEDECRDGSVIFDLPTPCHDQPRTLDCCVNEDKH